VLKITSEVSSEGELLHWEVDALVDGGAYNTLSPVVLSRLILHATGPYRCPSVQLKGVVVATHTPPNGAYRGFGAPQAQFAVERHMDRIARALKTDPLEFRRKNLLRDGDTTATGQTLQNTGAFAVLNEVLKEAPLLPVAEPRGSRNASWKRGQGLGLAFHGCGFTGNGESWLKGKAALELTGSQVRILTGSTDIGQGTETIFPQIVAEELGIPLSQVEMAPHDTAFVPDSGPTVASRTCMVVGSVVQSCAKKLRAALELETGLKGSFKELLAARTRTEKLVVDHVYEPDASIRWEDATYSGDAYPTFGWSANLVDLEVDTDTGEVRYHRLITATDVGRAINPVLVSGQIEGGAMQALGWATLEEVVRDEQGGMKNDRLTNYIIPTSLDAPELVTRLIEIPYANGPFGAKGVGEIPLDAPAAAVAAAIEAACGVVLDSLPMSPEKILAALDGDFK
jgi:CO/xanthine dehydrogenase Mo-binding subunit